MSEPTEEPMASVLSSPGALVEALQRLLDAKTERQLKMLQGLHENARRGQDCVQFGHGHKLLELQHQLNHQRQALGEKIERILLRAQDDIDEAAAARDELIQAVKSAGFDPTVRGIRDMAEMIAAYRETIQEMEYFGARDESELVERMAKAIHVAEYGKWHPDAVPDHNKWTWNGYETSDAERDIFRTYARAALKGLTDDEH